jgi:hypothetical protein
MGIMNFFGNSSCSCDDHDEKHQEVLDNPTKAKIANPTKAKIANPDPRNFKILRTAVRLGYLVVEVQYPDCVNYEGRKILVYKGLTGFEIRTQTFLDPHFCESSKHPSPIARFEPTDRGWDMAIKFINSI